MQANSDTAYSTDGRNQYTAVGGAAATHDANGNLTSGDGSGTLYKVTPGTKDRETGQVTLGNPVFKYGTAGFDSSGMLSLASGESGRGGPWIYSDREHPRGMPFHAVRPSGRLGGTVDTKSYTRHQAFRSAKYVNGIPAGSQPIAVYYPGTRAGERSGLRSDNVAYYLFANGAGQLIGIREDLPNAFQGPHFNSGLALEPGMPSQSLPNHHFFDGQ